MKEALIILLFLFWLHVVYVITVQVSKALEIYVLRVVYIIL